MTQHAPLTWSVSLERDGRHELVRVTAATRNEVDSTVLASQRAAFRKPTFASPERA